MPVYYISYTCLMNLNFAAFNFSLGPELPFMANGPQLGFWECFWLSVMSTNCNVHSGLECEGTFPLDKMTAQLRTHGVGHHAPRVSAASLGGVSSQTPPGVTSLGARRVLGDNESQLTEWLCCGTRKSSPVKGNRDGREQ